jgi:hypothetical protein
MRNQNNLISKQRDLISDQNTLLSEKETLLSEKEEKIKQNAQFVKLFDEPKERTSYDEWYKKRHNTDKKPTNTREWNEYWDEVCKDEYCAWYIRKISRYPIFLVNLITEIQKFDFEKVSENMKSINWTWNDRPESPTTEQMIDCIFSLASSLKEQNDKSGCSSGGFEVKRMTDDKAEIIFLFGSYMR